MKTIEILLIEDNPADAELTREMMEEAKIQNHLHVARDGDEAMAFLRKTGAFKDTPTPDLVLLDLNLPGRDGREVLREMKEDPELKTIPVVVLTSSEAQTDVAKSYGLHCNAYIRKPVGLEGYQEIVRALDSFWFRIVRLPSQV